MFVLSMELEKSAAGDRAVSYDAARRAGGR
jgi:hypothetical protein